MILKDVQRQNGKYVEGLFRVIRVDQPTPAEHGDKQIVRIADGYKQEADITVWHKYPETFIEPTFIGKQAMFRLRYKKGESGGYYEGYPSTAEPEPEQSETPNWQEINLGKCRHGILCAYIQHEGLPVESVFTDVREDGKLQNLIETKMLNKDRLDLINKLAHFSMTGEVE